MSEHSVIVGAGHGAAQLCASLRSEGWSGPITLIGEEPVLPYHRPPLSKTNLNPSGEHAPPLIRPDSFYVSKEITVLTNARVDAIDRARKLVRVGARDIAYDKLALCLGSVHIQPPIEGIDGARVFHLRTEAECTAIRSRVRPGARAVIIGGGFIGLEVAASLRRLGLEITVLERAPRVLSRVTSPEMSAFFEQLHRQEGVRLFCDTLVERITENGDVLEVWSKGSSESHKADFVVLGAGAAPNDALARSCGLDVDSGIVVNEYNQTSDPDIYALGDCCTQFRPLYQRRIRLESVQNALDQAKTVAASLNGKNTPHDAVPWFWSDQYEVKLQMVGLSDGFNRMVVRGSPEASQSFSLWYFRDGKLIAVDAVNDSAAYACAMKCMKTGLSPDPGHVGDEQMPIKEILRLTQENQHA